MSWLLPRRCRGTLAALLVIAAILENPRDASASQPFWFVSWQASKLHAILWRAVRRDAPLAECNKIVKMEDNRGCWRMVCELYYYSLLNLHPRSACLELCLFRSNFRERLGRSLV